MAIPAVVLLPVNWRNLGAVMLGWIHHRAQLPGIAESTRRPRHVRFGAARIGAGAPHHAGPELEQRYQAWRNASTVDDRRRELGELAQAFAPLIHATVRQYQLSPLAERLDLQQEAFIGLHEALHNYDPQRGVTLAGFVRWRIVGAVLDARRKWLRQSRPWRMNCSTESCTAHHDVVPETPDVDFEDTFSVITRGFSEREILILRLMILEGKTFRHIGACIGLHHVRVGQIYRAALEALRMNPRAQQLLAGKR